MGRIISATPSAERQKRERVAEIGVLVDLVDHAMQRAQFRRLSDAEVRRLVIVRRELVERGVAMPLSGYPQ